MIHIEKGYRYEGMLEELQEEIVTVRNALSTKIAQNMKPAFAAILKEKANIPCHGEVINDCLKLMSTFWGISEIEKKRPSGEGIVFLHGWNVYIQFFGLSESLLDEFLPKTFKKYSNPPFVQGLEDTDESFVEHYGIKRAEYDEIAATWDKVFEKEGTPLYRGFSFPFLSNHIFENALVTVHQEILKQQDPEKFKAQQAQKKEVVKANILGFLMNSLRTVPDLKVDDVLTEDIIVTHFDHNGVIDYEGIVKDFRKTIVSEFASAKAELAKQNEEAAKAAKEAPKKKVLKKKQK